MPELREGDVAEGNRVPAVRRQRERVKVYLAARFGRAAEIQAHVAELEALGHKVVSRWHRGDHVAKNAVRDAVPTLEERRLWATEDVDDLRSSQVVISFTEPPDSEHSRGGRHVEFGLAMAWMKATVVVGPMENVFHVLADHHFDTWPDLLAAWA